MFKHEGPSRSARNNEILAGYLAFVAGFTNSSGFVLVGSFTSHVTGSVGRLANDVATGQFGAAAFALILMISFFAGAVLASLLVEARARGVARAYGSALVLEAAALAAFMLLALLVRARSPRVLDAEAAALCLAMGAQNSLVTSLSGAVIRTTHLTGVVTDLGIDVARWLLWLRARGASSAARPAHVRTLLLLTIFVSFSLGAVLGAWLAVTHGAWAIAWPTAAILCAAAYALYERPRPV